MPIALGERAHRVAARAHDTPEPVLEDWSRYKATGSLASRNRLIAYYMRTHVRPVATRIHSGLPHAVELDDLLQQGYLGLIDAMNRYEVDRATRFETFSRQRIFGAIQDYLRSLDAVPRLTRSRSKRFQAARERFRKKHGRPPSSEELRPLVDLPEPVFRRLITDDRPARIVAFSNVQPDESEPDGDGDAMVAFEDRRHGGPARTAERRDFLRWLTRGLDDRDRLILILYYYEHMTMKEIGHTLGCSESRVSQRLDSILQQLRGRLAGLGAEVEFYAK